jgi:hypothetical protein
MVKEIDVTALASTLVPLGSAWHNWGHGGSGWWIVAVVLFWAILVSSARSSCDKCVMMVYGKNWSSEVGVGVDRRGA